MLPFALIAQNADGLQTNMGLYLKQYMGERQHYRHTAGG
jgi:hypothetical protein